MAVKISELRRQIADLETAVQVAREVRDTAESRAKESVQAEMARLRASMCCRCREVPPRTIDRSGPVLFLDVDGVLNDNHYSGICRDKCEILNSVILKVLNLKIVISSAWRWDIIEGNMTLRGFETMLRACGLLCAGRVIGYTDDDGVNDFENAGRAKLICNYATANRVSKFAAIDDMALTLPDHQFVQTNGDIGITSKNAERLIEIFTGKTTP